MFPFVAALVFLLATLVPAALAGGVLWLLRRSQRRYWRFVGWLHIGLFPLHLFVTFPVLLGLLGSRGLGTRGDERGYAGPRLDADGHVLIQTSRSLRAERAAEAPSVAAEIVAAAAARAQFVDGADGVRLRVFRIEAPKPSPVAIAVLVHGLFRSSMELEPVASMLHERGVECWLMDQRNHGGSSRAPFSGGLRESGDVVAVVAHVRAQAGNARLPLLLFGVSLGTVSVSLALPQIDDLAGVVLDAPIDDLTAAAHRMMTFDRPGDRRSMFWTPEPFRSLVLGALGLWSSFDPADVCPSDVLATLPPDLPMLVVGAGDDDRAPPATVEALYRRLPMQEPVKELWIEPGVGHGHVFLEAAQKYDAALGRLLARLRP